MGCWLCLSLERSVLLAPNRLRCTGSALQHALHLLRTSPAVAHLSHASPAVDGSSTIGSGDSRGGGGGGGGDSGGGGGGGGDRDSAGPTRLWARVILVSAGACNFGPGAVPNAWEVLDEDVATGRERSVLASAAGLFVCV